MDRRIQKALETMLADGKKEGLPLMVCSAYRDYQKQDQLMDNSIAKFVRGGMSYKDAFFKTKEEIALTGASEHHTGLAVDIVGKNHQGLDKSQASTKEAIWLNEHAASMVLFSVSRRTRWRSPGFPMNPGISATLGKRRRSYEGK